MTESENELFDVEACRVEFNGDLLLDLDEYESVEALVAPKQVLPIEMSDEIADNCSSLNQPSTSSTSLTWTEMITAKARFRLRLNELVSTDSQLSALRVKHNGIRFEVTSILKAKPGQGKVYTEIIRRILSSTGASQSQTQIRQEVANQFPDQTVPKDWTKPIPGWAVKNIQRRIWNSASPISEIQLPKAVTLSKLHNAAKAAIEKKKTGARAFKPVIEITDTGIVINGLTFPISANKVSGEIYKQVRISLPKLLQALELGR